MSHTIVPKAAKAVQVSFQINFPKLKYQTNLYHQTRLSRKLLSSDGLGALGIAVKHRASWLCSPHFFQTAEGKFDLRTSGKPTK